MQSAWSRIWTRVAVSISNDDNHYTTGTSLHHGQLTYGQYCIYVEMIKILVIHEGDSISEVKYY